MKHLVIGLVASAVAAVLVVIYLAAGWHGMEYECATSTAMKDNSSVSYSWSWSPLGFRCDYPDGSSTTELWY